MLRFALKANNQTRPKFLIKKIKKSVVFFNVKVEKFPIDPVLR